MQMTLAGLEPAIPGSVGRCLIHWATGPCALFAPGPQRPHCGEKSAAQIFQETFVGAPPLPKARTTPRGSEPRVQAAPAPRTHRDPPRGKGDCRSEWCLGPIQKQNELPRASRSLRVAISNWARSCRNVLRDLCAAVLDARPLYLHGRHRTFYMSATNAWLWPAPVTSKQPTTSSNLHCNIPVGTTDGKPAALVSQAG